MADVLTKLLLEHVGGESLPTWPVTWGVAMPAGAVQPDDALAVVDDTGSALPTQWRMLKAHPDGSAHRLIVIAEPPLPKAGRYEFTLQKASGSDAASSANFENQTLQGSVGTLQPIPDGFTLADLHLSLEARGRVVGDDSEMQTLRWKLDRVEPFEHGPFAAGAVYHGHMYADSEPLLAVRLTCRSSAQTPILFCDVWAKNLSNHAAIVLGQFRMTLKRNPTAPDWQEANYEVRQLPSRQTSALPLRVESKQLALHIELPDGKQDVTSRLLNGNETWFSVTDGQQRTTVGLRNFYEYYPYAIEVEPTRIDIDFWPDRDDSLWTLRQGVGKTHEIAIAVTDQASNYTPEALGYTFGKPPLARMPLQTMQQAAAFEELPAYLPDEHPRIETALFDLAYNRNRGFGKMNWGDDYSSLYTNQGRGSGDIVWNNLEGDHPYHVLCQTLRTGRYQFYKDFRDSILHWADVDFADKDADPANEGALRVHSRFHVTKAPMPCHNWAEGFVEWYCLTGEPRALEIVQRMADWIISKDASGYFKTQPHMYVRGWGWSLIQLAALQRLLDRDDIAQLARRLSDEALAYLRENGGLVMRLPTGGTWQPWDNAFHTATVIIGAYQNWKLQKRNAMRDLAIEAAEALMDERTCTPEGIAVYITGPEQSFPMQQAACFAMGGLALAYHLTEDDRYLKRGFRMLQYCLDRGMIVDHMRIPGRFTHIDEDVVLEPELLMPNTQLLSYQLRGLLLFMKPAIATGRLKKIEYVD